MRVFLIVVLAAVLGVGTGLGMAYRSNADQGEVYRQLMNALTKGPTLQEAGDDRVVVENGEEFDFGVMAHNDSKSHTFRIRNQTDQPLTLRIVEKTCKCTVGHLPDDAIPPGEVGEVVLEWTAKQFESDFRQSAVLETSDPIRSTISLAVFGQVMQLINVSPPSLAFTDVSFGANAEQSFVIQSYEEADFRVERWTWLNDDLASHFDVTIEPVAVATDIPSVDAQDAPTEPEQGTQATSGNRGRRRDSRRIPPVRSEWRATVQLKAGMPLGMFEQRLVLHTNSKSLDRIDVPLMGNVVSDVQIVGPGYRPRGRVLELGLIPSKKGLDRKLQILVKGPEASNFEITDIAVEPPGAMQVTVGKPRELQGGMVRHFPLEILIPAGTAPVNRLGSSGRPAGKIVLRTTHSVDSEIVIDTHFAIVDR